MSESVMTADAVNETAGTRPHPDAAENRCSVMTFDRAQPVAYGDELFGFMECAENDRWYEPPLSFDGLARQFFGAVHHQSSLYFKRNVIMGCFMPHPLLPRQVMSAFVLDYLVLGNAYLERRRNRLSGTLALKHVPARQARRGLQDDHYYFVRQWKDAHAFTPGSVFHLLNPDINQEVYGLPEYLAALLSARLNKSATLFRTHYYDNGSHAGVIVHLDGAMADKDLEDLKKSLTGLRGENAFRNLFVHTLGGGPNGEKALKILPFSQIATRDEFLHVKQTTRDDMLAMHRVPPQLMGMMPDGNGALGDVEKAARVFSVNELAPVMADLQSINDWLGEEVVRFKPYALLEILN